MIASSATGGRPVGVAMANMHNFMFLLTERPVCQNHIKFFNVYLKSTKLFCSLILIRHDYEFRLDIVDLVSVNRAIKFS